MACGSFCAFPVDINLLPGGSARRITGILNRQAPSLMRRKILFCSLLVSVGAKHLAIAPGARHQDVLRAMHELTPAIDGRGGLVA